MSPGSPWERTVAASKAYASQLDAMPAMTPTSRLSPTSRSSASPASPAARFWDEGRPSPRRDLKFRCLRKRGGPDPAFGAGGLKASASCGSLLTERSAYAADEAASLLGRTLVVSEVVRAGTRSPPPPSTLRRVPFARRPQTAPLPHLMPLGAGGASVRSYGDGSQTWDAKRAAIDGRRKLMQDALLAKQQQADAKEAGREARLAMKSGPDAERTAQGWLEVVALVARTAAMGPRAEAKIALRRHERAEYMAALALQRFMAARFWKALHLKMRKARRAMKRVKWRLCLAARCFRRRHATLVLRTFYREHGGSPFEFMMRRYKMRVVSLQRKIADFLRITYCRMYVLKLRWNRLESAARAEIEADRTHQQRNKPVFARPPRLAPMRVHDAKYPNYCAKVNRASNEGGKLMDTTYRLVEKHSSTQNVVDTLFRASDHLVQGGRQSLLPDAERSTLIREHLYQRRRDHTGVVARGPPSPRARAKQLRKSESNSDFGSGFENPYAVEAASSSAPGSPEAPAAPAMGSIDVEFARDVMHGLKTASDRPAIARLPRPQLLLLTGPGSEDLADKVRAMVEEHYDRLDAEQLKRTQSYVF